MAKIRNFGDVFPLRQLGAGEDWGRHLEARVEGIEAEITQIGQTISNEFRIANSRADIQADQILALFEQQEILMEQQEVLREQQSALAQQNESIIQLVNSMPRNDGGNTRQTGWSIDTAPVGGAWTTVATIAVPTPSNMNRVAVTAWGNASATSSNVFESAMQARIVIGGTGGEAVEGTMETLASTVRSTVNLAFFRELSASGNTTIQLQLRGRYDDFPASNVANLTVSASFTRVGL